MADFPRNDVTELLANCHRRCCICHRFCGSKMELDHMQPRAEGGASDIGNAIPVCFECHAEIHAYNDKHPKGRKFQPAELKLHKEQWLSFCERSPGTLAQMSSEVSVGPLQALINEMEFNIEVASHVSPDRIGCLFLDHQFRRAIQTGAISMLSNEIKNAINAAYVDAGRANQLLMVSQNQDFGTSIYLEAVKKAQRVLPDVAASTSEARDLMAAFLAPERGEG